MAEFVEYRTEEMIPELEMMEKIRLFENAEIKAIAKKRKEFEYKIQRRTKCKDDYLRYIQYEVDILQLIRLRRDKLGIESKKSEIDYTIANRVNKIFKEACFRFQDDVKIWLSHIKFCKQMRFHSSVSHILVRMLQVHGSERPALWKFAANWEMKEGRSMENARQFLLRGLRFHPEASLLYAEAFRLELMYASMLRQKKHQAEEECAMEARGGSDRASAATASATSINMIDIGGSQVPEDALGVMAPLGNIGIAGEAARDQVMEGKLAMLMYESSVKKVKDVGFIISLLSIAKEYDFTQHLQEKIIQDLLTYFPNEELTWDTMARRELEGLSYSLIAPNNSISVTPSVEQSVLGAVNSEVPSTSIPSILPQTPGKPIPTKVKKKPKISLKERIRSCCAVYDAAVKHLDTECMWSLYIECLLELLGNGASVSGRVRDGSAGGSPTKNRNASQTNPFPRFTRKLILQAFRAAHNARKMTERYYLMWVDMLQGDNNPNATLAALSGMGKVKKGTGKVGAVKGKKGAGGAVGGGSVVGGKKGGAAGKKGKGAVGQHKKVARILAAATERLPLSSELWMTRLRHHICHSGSAGSSVNKNSEAKESPGTDMDAPNGSQPSSSGQQAKIPMPEVVFAQASAQLGDVQDAVPIWKVMLHYTQARGNTARVESLFQDALKRGPAIALAFKPLYIEWIVLLKGISAARKVYDQISVQPPLCLELHTKMAHFEDMQPTENTLKHARKCFELACDQFGKSNTDVWMEYVKFEMHKGCPKNIPAIYWRALKTLDNLQGDIFISEFNLLKTGMGAALPPSTGGVIPMQNNNLLASDSTPMILG